MYTSTFLLTSLIAITINAQSHPMITPAPAPLVLRQANDEEDVADCFNSIGQYMTCIGKAVSTNLCINTTNLNADLECGCRQASSLYACYTSYCTPGKHQTEFVDAVDDCGVPYIGGPAPTGSPNAGSDDGHASDDENNATKTGGAPAAATKPSSAGSLNTGIWGLMAVGAVVGLL
ncbi:hypothetical protein QBC36DRAFT_337995, partial [Triangularia setosa]